MSVGFRLRRHLVFLRHLFWEAYRERILVSIVATIVFATLISILNKIFYGHVIWERFYTESDAGTFFCEYTDMNKLIRQPVNTVTNFVYFVIAIYCFSKGMEDIKKDRAYNLITANRFYSFTLAAVMLYTFIGSTLFHSSLIEFFSKMDFSAVYSITLFPAMYFSHRVILTLQNKPTNIRRSKERFFLIGIFSLIYLILSFNLDMSVVHPAVASIIVLIILTGVYLERKRPGQTNKNYLIACIVSILLAGLFFELDIKKIFCSDMGRISPHSLWHIFNGLSIFFFYLYIRSENYDASQDKLRLKLMERATLRVTKSK
jgi:phosphate/sulfate permease